MKRILIALIALTLTGCFGYFDRMAYFGAECEKAGYQPDTDLHNGCVDAHERALGSAVAVPIMSRR